MFRQTSKRSSEISDDLFSILLNRIHIPIPSFPRRQESRHSVFRNVWRLP
ncbi:hypothetical protein HMPREF3156_00605 [Neisseria sp. HMSC06F02]|nr:hypothetical protein HMPREF3156_00605 [Neisseria sp. HMSC06F02]